MSSGMSSSFFEEEKPQSFQMFAFHGIQLGRYASSDMVEPIIHELDDVEMIEHDLSFREVFGKPGGVRICHVHRNKLQFTCTQFAPRSFQSRNSFALAYMDDRAAFQISHDREEGSVRLTMPDVNFIDTDRLDFRCVNCCKFVLEISLLDLFHRMPPQMKVVRQSPDTDLFPELEDRPLKLVAEAGFRVRNERDLLNETLMATVAVHLMQRVNEMNFPNPPHRQTSHVSFVENSQRDIL